MYSEFYGLKEMPFSMTPNPLFFFESAKHIEALNSLRYVIEQRKGFVVITGDIGAGKTTICRTLLSQLEAEVITALITHTHIISGKDLLYTVLEDLEIDFTPGSKARLLSQLNLFLIEQMRNNRNVVLLIDEAQNLSTSVLEEIRMLSNLETESEKLIQIIFMGQPELRKKLAQSNLEQLRQRVALFYQLTPLDQDDTTRYIRHRLKVAGAQEEQQIFTSEALELIYQFSKGVPRLINQICDSALLSGYVYGTKNVDKGLMEEVIHESPLTQIMK